MAEEQVAKIRDEKPCSPETGLDHGAESLTQEIYWTLVKKISTPTLSQFHNRKKNGSFRIPMHLFVHA